MKRQNSQLSSTSRRDNSPESLRAKSIGCMSGIIHLLSKYQNRHKKSLTFGKSKHEKDIVVVSSPSDQILVSATNTPQASPLSQGQRKPRNDKEGKGTEVDLRRFSCELPTRSPTLSAEIRRSNSAKSPASIGTSPALVARLMGLEVVPTAPHLPPVETSSEKRRKLLGALEKCDNDLKALKEVIVAFRSAESHQSAAPIAGSFHTQDKVRLISGGKCRDYNCGEQQPSPVSVLDEFSRLHLNRIDSTSKGWENGQETDQQQAVRKKAAVDEDCSCNLTMLERRIKLQSQETKPSEKKKKKKKTTDHPSLIMWRSKAMVESLDEISKEISWGCNREMGRIGMALQHHIYRDLIEEMITDMGFSTCFRIDSLPFEACRRRLRF